jgi:hypothetical protein
MSDDHTKLPIKPKPNKSDDLDSIFDEFDHLKEPKPQTKTVEAIVQLPPQETSEHSSESPLEQKKDLGEISLDEMFLGPRTTDESEQPPDEGPVLDEEEDLRRLAEKQHIFDDTDVKEPNLIEEFISIVSEVVDSPKVFVECGAYHLISCTMGPFVWIVGATHERPNSWTILSSIPGRMRRSKLHSYVTRVYKRAMNKIFYTIIPNTDSIEESEWRKIINEMVEVSIIEEGSSEGLIDHVESAYVKYGLKYFAIMSTEFGAVLEKMAGTHYEASVPALLSKFKYGESGIQYLSKRGGKNPGRYIPPNLYITMFAGMQEPEYYITNRQSRQGLLRRLNIAYVKTEDLSMENWIPPIEIGRERIYGELDVFADKLADKALELYSKRSFTPDSTSDNFIKVAFLPMLELNEIAKSIDADLIKPNPNNFEIYRQGKIEQLSEFAVLHALSEMRSYAPHDEWQIFVNQEDFDAAKQIHGAIHKNAEEIFDNLSASSETAKTQKNDLERIYLIIQRTGRAGISSSDLIRKANLIKENLEGLLDTLTLSEKIFVSKPQSTGGRRPTIYYANVHFDEAEVEVMKSQS